MGKGRPRAVEKGVLGQSSTVSSSGSPNIPLGPVYYPTEDEFKEPLEFIYKIRPEAEPYGICKIVPPMSWKPPFAQNLDSFTFPTKSQAIHQLQARCAPCDPKTFELEYNRFLEEHCGRKFKKKVVFEGEELDFCKLFNAVKRYGGYDKVVDKKKWGEVYRFVRPGAKISECAKHVLCQTYREHLYDYENYYNKLNQEKTKGCKLGLHSERKTQDVCDVSSFSSSKRRRKDLEGERVKEVKVEEEDLDQICEQCKSGLHGEVMLLCDRCNKGWHIYCLSPPLKRVPPGNWYCLECLNSDKDSFGFVPGKRFSLEAFRRFADRAKRKWFGPAPVSRARMEKKFWEIVEGLAGGVEVMYGSDLDTSVHGSGFPRINDERPASIEAEEWDKYCASPWNLNNLPKLQGSMLRVVHNSIAGVMVPWLYIGMLFSAFCWHFEDHCFYSMNYLHWGEPKCWYSVPGNEASAFEKVMRNSLPDLFDAQPDLLFQLVTMLNPSVLLENGVPVYTVLQEPGNFVITFPRSYHGGFNFGLNCAEAVNFAPADWLPHGGFGAELYQLYHKAAVLSHEELLCVVSKSDFDIRALPYLKKELSRMYDKEKTWRERLWRNGIVHSNPMSPRKHPDYIGTEEDPTCIICQQYVYLSAVTCRCRPSTFVCLEHWEHLCECKPNKLCLLYRHTLAELKDLVLMTDKLDSSLEGQDRNLRRQLSSSDGSTALTRKVKGRLVTFLQVAEEWRLRSCKILQVPYSPENYAKALREAEQFLWAGLDMDQVRNMRKNLIEAQNWAEGLRDCLLKVETWSHDDDLDIEKVQLDHLNNLLSFNPRPCNEPALLKLKDYEQEAKALSHEIDCTLSACPKVSIDDWEILCARVSKSPIYINGSEKIVQQLSSVRAWIESVRKCISEKSPAAIEPDYLYELQSQISELPVQLPEAENLLALISQVELCQARCDQLLKGSLNLKQLEACIKELDNFTVNIPQLKLLRQYYNDAISWVSHCNNILSDIEHWEDQEKAVNELTCIQRDASSLKIQVDEELPRVEIELKKACCRVKALKALSNRMSLDFIQQVMLEAIELQIERERLFSNISGIVAAAMCWEERAKHILSTEAQMNAFEEAIRASEDIHVTLPSLDMVKNSVSLAKTWLEKSKPFLISDSSVEPVSLSLLKIEDLKGLVLQSKHLKISLRERSMLQRVLDNCIEWEHDACSLLHTVACLLNIDNIDGAGGGLVPKIEQLITKIESIIKAGMSLGLDFDEVPKLQDACSTLQWCLKVLSFTSAVPKLEEVEKLMDIDGLLPATFASTSLFSLLSDGMQWLKKAVEVHDPCNHGKYKLSDAVEVLEQSQRIKVFFPQIVSQLDNSTRKHNSWLEQVHLFFSLKPGDRSWMSLLELKESGSMDAFDCPELDMVSSEVQKVEQWKQRCKDILGTSIGDVKSLIHALVEVTNNLERSLYILRASNGCKKREQCVCCSSNIEDQEHLTCSVCKDCYHMQCKGPTPADMNDTALSICHYCLFLMSGNLSQNGSSLVRFKGKHAEFNELVELLSDADNLSVWIEERGILDLLVEKALAWKGCLTEVLEFALNYHDEDISIVVRKLSAIMKAVEVAGICDQQDTCNFELALARNSWRVRANKMLGSPLKTSIQHIQWHLKEGLAISMHPEDHFWQKLSEMKHIAIIWADKAQKVSMDSGALGLDKVFELITEGENLPVLCENELQLLRDRSMLYCICRKPYDQRAMIACDRCNEWYHFDCIELSIEPKMYICPACKLPSEDFSSQPMLTLDRATGPKCEEPQTPSPRRRKLGCKSRKPKSGMKENILVTADDSSISRQSSGSERLFWRNRKPFRRAARKRSQLATLSQFFYIQK
ncbi:hypothetical protein NMG60_11027112 [Bertholletia excelsa]